MAELWRKCCNGTAPFVILTGMADGADQIAAEAALELSSDLNIKIVAVLPMQEELFINTIENKERFNRLLQMASYKFSIPLTPDNVGHEAELANICSETEYRRQEQYASLSRFLALHSHVLFAFWDGVPTTQLKGGTADTVFFKLNGNTETQTQGDLLTFSSVGPVVHLLIPRDNQDNRDYPLDPDLDMTSIPIFYLTRDIIRSNPGFNALSSLSNQNFDRSVFNQEFRCKTPISDIPEIQVVLSKIGALNKFSVLKFRWRSFIKKCKDSYNGLFNIEKDISTQNAVADELFSNSFENLNQYEDCNTRLLVEHYTVADKMAETYQWYSTWTIRLYTFVFAVLSFLIGTLSTFGSVKSYGWAQEPESIFNYVWANYETGSCFKYSCCPLLSKIYIGLACFLVVIYIIAKNKEFHYRYHRFRAIAEALRIQIYWRIAGIGDCVSGYYRSHQIPETEWIRAAVYGLDVFLSNPSDSDFLASPTERIQFVKQNWVLGQRKYFSDKSTKKKNEQKGFRYYFTHQYMLLALAGLFFCLPIKSEFIKRCYSSCNQSDSAIMFFVIVGLAVSLITSLVIYCTMSLKFKRAKQEAKRFEQILFPFDRAALLLNIPRSDEEQKMILRQLGTEAVSENVNWLLTVGEQDLNLPR